MTITLDKLVQAQIALRYIAQKELSIKHAYHLARLIDFVEIQTKPYFEKRNELIKKLGIERDTTQAEKDQQMGNTVFEVLPKNIEEFKAQEIELGSIEITVDKWLLTTEMFKDIKVSGWAIHALGNLIED